MAKRKETKLVEEIREEEPLETKGPLRDEPELAYSPAWEVVNDRQNILTDKIPPKIYSLEALLAAGIVTEEMLADGGYVKNTDYASASNGGVIKTRDGYATAVGGSGALTSTVRTRVQYETDASAMFISKGTLENIKRLIVESALSLFCDATSPSATVGTQLGALAMTKTESGWVLSFNSITPPEP